jgi:asparagine N-glycosylation enzyme membrane subunit Stt3
MTAFIIIIPYLPYSNTKLEYLLPVLAIVALAMFLTRKLEAKNRKVYVIGWLAVFALAFVVVWKFYPAMWYQIQLQLTSIFWGVGSSILEARPMDFTLFMFQYGLIVMFFVFGIVMAIRNKVSTLFIVFSILWIIAMLGQRRWGYYASVPIALYGAYCIDRVLANTGKRFKVAVACVIALMISFTLVPGNMSVVKSQPDMTENWYRALVWMRENTPEPFDTPDAYYTETREKAKYSALSWWDFGSWGVYYSHRAYTCTNQYQTSPKTARFLTSQNEEQAAEALEGWNIRYILIDFRMVSGGLYYAFQNMATGSYDGWKDGFPNSTVKKLYETENYAGYHLLKQFGDVKIFEANQYVN